MKKRRLFCHVICLFLFCLVGILGLSAKSQARGSDVIGTDYSETEGGTATVGTRIVLDKKEISHVYDSWLYSGNSGWSLQYSSVEGERVPEKTLYFGEYVALEYPPNVHLRNIVIATKIAKILPEHYMVQVKRYQEGKLLSVQKEYSNCSSAECIQDAYSFQSAVIRNNVVYCSTMDARGVSYIYQINTGLTIGAKGDIVAESQGAEISGEGMAYYQDGRYTVESLPEATHPSDYYDYEFAGWYTQEEGGTRVQIGSSISKDTRLYAHWNRTIASYKVTCVDVLQDQNLHITLGNSEMDVTYGAQISGSMFGADQTAGVYYPGREYVSDTSVEVFDNSSIVYRYFKTAYYTVQCIDLVQSGPDAGVSLGMSTYEESYDKPTSGGAIGDKKDIGQYYKGYQFMSSTSIITTAGNNQVYRYFTPIQYDIAFCGDETVSSSMAAITGCYYGHGYQLTKNTLIKRSKITFDLNGENATCNKGFMYVYHDFEGWADEISGPARYSDGASIFNLCSVPEVKRLYASWSPKEMVVEAVPSRLGYEFAGWSRDPHAITGETQFQINEDETLYAIWKPASVKYHVEYYKQRLDKTFEKCASYEFDGYTDTQVAVEKKIDLYPGFYLDSDSSSMEGTVKADGSLILCAYYRRGEYTVSYDLNGGKLEKGDIAELSSKTGFYEAKIDIPDLQLTKTGYSFAGWGIEPDEKHVACHPGEEYTIANHDQVLYAIWNPNNNTKYQIIPYFENISDQGYTQGEAIIRYGTTDVSIWNQMMQEHGSQIESIYADIIPEGFYLGDASALHNVNIAADGSSVASLYLRRNHYVITYQTEEKAESQVATQSAIYGSKYTMPEAIESLDAVGRFCCGDRKYLPGEQITIQSNMTFICEYRIALHSNALGEDDVMLYGRKGSQIEIPSFTRKGYVFQGWYYDARCTSLALTGAATWRDISSNQSFYAKWSQPLNYSIIYDFGEYTTVKWRHNAVSSYQYGRTVTLPTADDIVIPENYTFAGWYESGDSSKKLITVLDPDTIGNKSFVLLLYPQGSEPTLSPSTRPSSDTAIYTTAPSGSPEVEKTTAPSPESSVLPNVSVMPTASVLPVPTALVTPRPTSVPIPTTSVTPIPTATQNVSNTDNVSHSSTNTEQISTISTWIGSTPVPGAALKTNLTKSGLAKKGSSITKHRLTYKVTSATLSKRTVALNKAAKSLTKVTVPKSILINGYRYQVTAVGDNAFRKCSKLKKVKVGENIKSIGKNAFMQCKRLKTVSIQSKKIQNVGSNAWKGVSSQCKIQMKSSSSSAMKKAMMKSTKNKCSLLQR